MNILVWNKLLAGWFLVNACHLCRVCFVLGGGADGSSLVSFVWSAHLLVSLYPLAAQHLALRSSLTSSTRSYWPQLQPSPLTSDLSQFFQSLKEGIRRCIWQRAVMLSIEKGLCSQPGVQHPSRALQLRGSSRGCQWGGSSSIMLGLVEEVGGLFPLGKLEEQ